MSASAIRDHAVLPKDGPRVSPVSPGFPVSLLAQGKFWQNFLPGLKSSGNGMERLAQRWATELEWNSLMTIVIPKILLDKRDYTQAMGMCFQDLFVRFPGRFRNSVKGSWGMAFARPASQTVRAMVERVWLSRGSFVVICCHRRLLSSYPLVGKIDHERKRSIEFPLGPVEIACLFASQGSEVWSSLPEIIRCDGYLFKQPGKHFVFRNTPRADTGSSIGQPQGQSLEFTAVPSDLAKSVAAPRGFIVSA